jgi:hypothetical protein
VVYLVVISVMVRDPHAVLPPENKGTK